MPIAQADVIIGMPTDRTTSGATSATNRGNKLLHNPGRVPVWLLMGYYHQLPVAPFINMG